MTIVALVTYPASYAGQTADHSLTARNTSDVESDPALYSLPVQGGTGPENGLLSPVTGDQLTSPITGDRLIY